MPIARFKLEQTALLVVDVQERLHPLMHNAEAMATQAGRLIQGAHVLEMPVLVTEQYRKGLGLTIAPLAELLKTAVCNYEKMKFSACIEAVKAELMGRNVRSVVVCGIEAHVCVLQTCLDLIEAGYVTAVAADAIGSRRQIDMNTALMRMSQAGVVPTTVESILLELVGEAGTSRFKAILPIIK